MAVFLRDQELCVGGPRARELSLGDGGIAKLPTLVKDEELSQIAGSSPSRYLGKYRI